MADDWCTVYASSDRCAKLRGHDGEHMTFWGNVRMYWNGTEEWSHNLGTPHA